jgi:hypothetical protein
MAGGKRGCEAPIEEQEAFIRENAVALVRAKQEKIARLRKRVTQLERTCAALRAQIVRERVQWIELALRQGNG